MTAAEVALAWLLGLAPERRRDPGRAAAETAAPPRAPRALELGEQAALTGALRARGRPERRGRGTEVVLVMGIPGAGKSRVADGTSTAATSVSTATSAAARCATLAEALDETLAAGARQVVLDNTYLTRASRSYVVDAAAATGARCGASGSTRRSRRRRSTSSSGCSSGSARCRRPRSCARSPRRSRALLAPTSQMRAVRELEPPSADEGFAGIERVTFARERGRSKRAGVFVAAAALRPSSTGAIADAPHLVFDWRPTAATTSRLPRFATSPAPSTVAVCPHPGGPPTCWCRPPLPGLPLAFARAHDVDPARSTLVGTSAAHRQLATDARRRLHRGVS